MKRCWRRAVFLLAFLVLGAVVRGGPECDPVYGGGFVILNFRLGILVFPEQTDVYLGAERYWQPLDWRVPTSMLCLSLLGLLGWMRWRRWRRLRASRLMA